VLSPLKMEYNNIVICNWGKLNPLIQLVELSPNKKVCYVIKASDALDK
jgi:uncharacterized protein (DUF39 family)